MPYKLTLPAVFLFLTGCERGPAGPLPDQPDQLVVYSIDGPTWYKNGSKLTEDQSRGEVLDGYPVLGKVEVTDPGQRQKVYSAIRGAVRNPPPGSKCFIPRHAIRAVKGDETVDMVICFQCHNYEHHRGGKEVSGPNPLISSDPEALLDKILSDAGVPLASKDPP